MIPHLPTQLIRNVVRAATVLSPYRARKGEGLDQHSTVTALITASLTTYTVASSLGINGSDWFYKGAALSAIAGLLHDIGKALPEYQAHLMGEEDAGIRHEIASFIVAANALEYVSSAGLAAWVGVLGSILYHHHGLYDITDKITNYLYTGRRAWTRARCGQELEGAAESFAKLIASLATILDDAGLSQHLRVKEGEVREPQYWCRPINDLISDGVIRRAVEAERIINRYRGAAVILLSNLMIADNLAAHCALRSGASDSEEGRINTVARHGIYPVALRARFVRELLKEAGYGHMMPCIENISGGDVY